MVVDCPDDDLRLRAANRDVPLPHPDRTLVNFVERLWANAVIVLGS